MGELRISRRAERDLAEIADFTLSTFGSSQALRYRTLFQRCFDSLCTNPELGRSANDLAPGLRRLRQQAHVIFYQAEDERVVIVRVLHHRMDFEQHLQG